MLSQLGIASINLATDNTDQTLADGSKITGETTYTIRRQHAYRGRRFVCL
jgi:hypothetical protein